MNSKIKFKNSHNVFLNLILIKQNYWINYKKDFYFYVRFIQKKNYQTLKMKNKKFFINGR